jgi:tetratricopeptide (TPR) repeat protein
MGWLLALVGAALVLIGACRGEGGPDFPTVRAAARAGVLTGAAAIVLALLPATLCAVQIERARAAVERGDLALALSRLEWAARILPVLRHNGDFVDEVGLLHGRLGRRTPEAALRESRILLQQGRFDEAELALTSMAEDPSSPPVVHVEAVRALLRRGIRELNSGATAAAVETLESVLAVDPCNVKANYGLELAYLRTGRLASVAPLAARMRKVYRLVNTLSKVPVLAAVQENVAYAAYFGGDADGALSARQLLSDPKALTKEP